MEALLYVLLAIMVILLVAVTAVNFSWTRLSLFELKRRQTDGDKLASRQLTKLHLREHLLSLQIILSLVLLSFIVLIAITVFGLVYGILASLLVVFTHRRLSRIKFLFGWSQKLYNRHETKIVQFVDKHKTIFGIFRSQAATNTNSHAVSSREELVDLIGKSENILDKNQKQHLQNSLDFPNRKVSDVMTVKLMIDTVNKNELIGPLVLDDLHKTGHSRFPVVDGDIDNVIGILNIRDMISLRDKKSQPASEIMQPVHYILQDQTLQQALAAFVKTRNSLFVVINEFRETVGLLSLEDVMEALFGQKLNDEYDFHDDINSVAKRGTDKHGLSVSRHDV